MLALRYRSACEGEKAAVADDVPAEEHANYTETTAQIRQYAQALGLEAPGIDRSKPWPVYVCGDERLPTASWRVKEMFSRVDLSSVYPILSGYTHGELFTLLREFEQVAHGNMSMNYRSIVNENSFKNAVAVASYALYPPGERWNTLFGLG